MRCNDSLDHEVAMQIARFFLPTGTCIAALNNSDFSLRVRANVRSTDGESSRVFSEL